MINKKKMKQVRRIKYLLFISLPTALMICSQTETVARNTKSNSRVVLQNVENKTYEEARTMPTPPALTKVIVEKSPPQDKKKAPKDTISNNEATSADDIVYEVAEPMPSFPDGMQALMTYLRRKIILREEVICHDIGRVIVQFIVQKDGTIAHPRITKSLDPWLDAEALRIISTMPKWTPGKINGEPVSVKYTVPVMFSH